jgi:hypothetical protein
LTALPLAVKMKELATWAARQQTVLDVLRGESACDGSLTVCGNRNIAGPQQVRVGYEQGELKDFDGGENSQMLIRESGRLGSGDPEAR